ncbi:MAG TPA: glycosyltransferase family 4 protein [Candidatus Dormibacteraeota bacterium]|nr:glycosyltransferase family 4 protein [Candidatus Dormibacteraeota bacterium]
MDRVGPRDRQPVAARFLFVMEQTLGHVAHTRNLERALGRQDWIQGDVARLPFEASGPWRLPGLRNWSVRSSLMARAALRRRLRQGPLDAAFVHTQVASLLSAGVMGRVPTVVSLDATPRNFDDVGQAYGHRRRGALSEAAKTLVNRRALLAAAALVTWSRLAADSLTADYGVPPQRVHVIPPGVDTERFRPRGEAPADGAVRVLFVGGDFVRKGGRDLLVAMDGLQAELDVVTAAPVGPTPPGVRCRVHRGLGPGDPALLELYRRADVFALPSHGDCLPQVLAEAAAAGLPIVSTPTGAVPEIVRDGVNGLLVPVASPAALRTALGRLIERPALRQAMGRESLALARRDHDAMVNHGRIFELMARVAGLASGQAAGNGAGRAADLVAAT